MNETFDLMAELVEKTVAAFSCMLDELVKSVQAEAVKKE